MADISREDISDFIWRKKRNTTPDGKLRQRPRNIVCSGLGCLICERTACLNCLKDFWRYECGAPSIYLTDAVITGEHP